MKENLRKWLKKWRQEFSEHKFLILLSFFILIIANIASYYASLHVDSIHTVAVPDLILDHIPTLNLNIFFIYGFYAIVLVIIFYTLFFHIKDAHEIIFLFSVLILVRSFFMILTHLSIPLNAAIITGAPAFLKSFYFSNDLFFSGHTAMPFMAFLIFRKEKISIFFITMTAIMALTVLFMHIHYSIDVFAAFFITYAIYKLGPRLCTYCKI